MAKTKVKSKKSKGKTATKLAGKNTVSPRQCRGLSQTENQFIEIVNWKKAQPKLKGRDNTWCKLYTSLLDHDGFAGLDDSARVLIIALWLYAARTGLHILPADPKWLFRKIPLLNAEPDLQPLLDAADAFGEPTPFIRFCQSPKAGNFRPDRSKSKTKKATGTGVATRTRRAQETRVEETRVREKREETRVEKPLRVSEEKKRKKKPLRVSKDQIGTEAAQTDEKQTEEQKTAEPEKTDNPKESEAGSAKRHILPKPARSAYHGGPQRIGAVIGARFPDHWLDADAESFGWEIVRALGMPDDPDNMAVRSEWGAFASWWVKVKKTVPAGVNEDLRSIAINKAEYVRRKAKTARNKSAVWFHIMAGELDHRGIGLPKKRAGP